MFWNLKRSGKLNKLKALIIGGFKIKPADTVEEEFGKNLYDIVLEKVKLYNYPVCFDFPVGHQKNNFALKCGVRHRLTVENNECSLKEINLQDISYLKAEGSYTQIYFASNTKMLISKNLRHFEFILTNIKSFIRIHRSFIVNINFAKKISLKVCHCQ